MEQWLRCWIRRIHTSLPKTALENLALIVDETKISMNHRAMFVSAPLERRAIPPIWRVYDENDDDDYPEEGQPLMIANMLAIVKSAFRLNVRTA